MKEAYSLEKRQSIVLAKSIGRWPEIFKRLAPAPVAAIVDSRGKKCECENHGSRTKKAVYLLKNFRDFGGGGCNTCGTFSNGVLFLAFLTGKAVGQVIDSLEEYHRGLPISEVPRPVVSVRSKLPEERQWAKQGHADVRAKLKPLFTDEAVSRYFLKRGFPACLQVKDLYCASLAYSHRNEKGRYEKHGPFPTMVAVVRDENGGFITYHRTYLNEDGSKLSIPGLEIECRKLMSAVMENGLVDSSPAIRLFPLSGDTVHLAEGIETAIGVHLGTGAPCWSVISSVNLVKFRPPKGVRKVVIWADRDKALGGQAYAAQAAHVLLMDGYSVEVLLPPLTIPNEGKGVDWADVWCQLGAGGFPKLDTA